MQPKNSKYARLEDFPEDQETGGVPQGTLGFEDEQMTYFADISKTWHHIDNLDDFFKRVYLYHQRNGFLCIATSEVFSLIQFAFVIFLSTLLIQCIDYPVLFNYADTISLNLTNYISQDKTLSFAYPQKIKIADVIFPLDQCLTSGSTFMQTLQLLALLFWMFRLARAVLVMAKFWETRQFYETALIIPTSELANYTWFDILERLKRVQSDHQMCIHKRELTSLDIYSRILRFKNYEIAMVNKDILPVKFNIPCFGQYTFMSQGLKLNFGFILFWGFGAPFSNSWSLKDVYKRKAARIQLANELSKRILLAGLVNLVFSPLIFFYQLLLSFFSYADLIKRDPSSLGMRKWSLYSRLYLRHYNELEHEFNARLARAYKPATMYLNCFISTFASIIAHNLAFFSGSICAVIILLTMIDDDVLQVDNVISLVTFTGALTAVSRVFIPDENFIFCPELLLKSVLAHIHYMPATWRGKAHTSDVRDEFSKFFQLKLVFFVEELLSPIVTPLILLFAFRPRALEIIDFLRNFSIDVAGVGDVCSFAQFDVNKHGNPHWLDEDDDLNQENEDPKPQFRVGPSQAMQSEDGKTELSLVNFALTNPNWRPNQASEVFLTNLKGQVKKDASMMISVRNIENSGFLHSMQNSSLFMQPLSIPPAIKESVLENTSMISPAFGRNSSSQGAQTNLPLKGPGIAAKIGPLQQVNTTSDSAASVYVSQHSNFEPDNQVISEQSVLSLAASLANQNQVTSGILSSQGDTNPSVNNVLSVEMSATVLKLHERYHQNAASKCVITSDSFQTVDDEINTNRSSNQQNSSTTNRYLFASPSLAVPQSSDLNGISTDDGNFGDPDAAVGFGSHFEEFDFTLRPLDKPPPESVI
ncbi:autophagy-related protein 9A-like [Convolutriloba macropyga]|uniref:autophagy-related protein 9A-like n=1 Tax=Convolutriloba macropyga TaxID=536237 RepID=UPI003F527F87